MFKTYVSADEFLRIALDPANADRRFELIDGEIVEKMPTQLHALIANLFNAVLFMYFRAQSDGNVT